MKIKHVFATLALAGVMAVGVGAAIGLNAGQKVESVAASSGSVIVDIKYAEHDGTTRWVGSGGKMGIYLWNGLDGVEKEEGWSDIVTVNSSNAIYTVNYSVSFNPVKMIVVRLNNDATVGDWDKKWNQTVDLNFGDVAVIAGEMKYDNSTVGASYNFPTTNGLDSEVVMNNYHRSSSDKEEFYKTGVSLETGDKFAIDFDDNSYFEFNLNGAVANNFKTTGKQIEVVTGGKYDFYFDTDARTLYVQADAETEAASWAKGFVEGLNCDSGYTIAPNNWSTYSTSYGQLNEGARHILGDATANKNGTDIEKAAFMHDLCVSKYPTACPAFMQKTGGALRTAVITKNVIANSVENNVSLVVIIAVASLSVLAAGGYFFYRKRKEN